MKSLGPALLLSLLAALLGGCHNAPSASAPAIESVTAHIVSSSQQDVATTLRATGTLHARRSSILSAQVTGRVRQVLVQEGDAVRTGQTLLVIDDASLRASMQQAQAGIMAAQKQQQAAQSESTLAESTLARYRQLQQQKSVSPQEMDEIAHRAEGASARTASALAQVEAARAQASGAKAMLSYARIVAPFHGYITARMVDPGTMAAPGVPLLQVESAGALQLIVSVDESAIHHLQRGMKIAIHIDGAPQTVHAGVVREILPAADAASHSFAVKIDLPASPQLHAGIFGSARIETGRHRAVLAPLSAIVQRGSLQYVYVVDSNQMARLRAITTGQRQGNVIEVLSGLSAQEQLIDQPLDRDLDGKRIEAR